MYFQIAQVFAPVFNPSTAESDFGIPLRQHADINESIFRSSVKETYDKIILDLRSAITLLPDKPLYQTRPSKAAAYAMLSRVYQTMEDYHLAHLYADSSLMIQADLLDYNTLDTTSYSPFDWNNKEVIFNSSIVAVDNSSITPYVNIVDSNLYAQYDSNDLRKYLYYKAIPALTFNGYYNSSGAVFSGLATDEVYLIRAECFAREQKPNEAMAVLNQLLESRWISAKYQPLAAMDAADALDKVLVERRKELIQRGLRWTDLRRLNHDPKYAKSLSRQALGKTYTLPPNDPRYVYPIPDNVIQFNKNLPQNKR
jgi:hypothetical protein